MFIWWTHVVWAWLWEAFPWLPSVGGPQEPVARMAELRSSCGCSQMRVQSLLCCHLDLAQWFLLQGLPMASPHHMWWALGSQLPFLPALGRCSWLLNCRLGCSQLAIPCRTPGLHLLWASLGVRTAGAVSSPSAAVPLPPSAVHLCLIA